MNVRHIVGNQSTVQNSSTTKSIKINHQAAIYYVSSQGNWSCTYTIFGMHELWTKNLTVTRELYTVYSFNSSGTISYDTYTSKNCKIEKIWTDGYDRPQNTNTDRWDNVFIAQPFKV